MASTSADPPRKKRILCLDGGGLRGVFTIQLLRRLRRELGCELWEAFDMICGTSTGGILSIMIGVLHMSLDECDRLYDYMGKYAITGPSMDTKANMAKGSSFYKADPMEEVFRHYCGERLMCQEHKEHWTLVPPPVVVATPAVTPVPVTAAAAATVTTSTTTTTTTTTSTSRSGQMAASVSKGWSSFVASATNAVDRINAPSTTASSSSTPTALALPPTTLVPLLPIGPNQPRVFTVSAQCDITPGRPYLFRNYELPPCDDATTQRHRYPGSCSHKLWEAGRATSAAPFFFPFVTVGDHQFMDGGLLANNPSQIAYLEALSLWGSDSIGCLISIGTGQQPRKYTKVNPSPWPWELGRSVVEVCMGTEQVEWMVHHLLGKRFVRISGFINNDTMDQPKLIPEWRLNGEDTAAAYDWINVRRVWTEANAS